MAHVRDSQVCVPSLVLVVLFLTIAPPATPAFAADFCGADSILVASHADTIFVTHLHASKSCCLVLSVRSTQGQQIVSFYEDDLAQLCHCICCYDHHYTATGFGEGDYLVSVYNADGSFLYGQQDVTVIGRPGMIVVQPPVQGDCDSPQLTHSTTWGLLRILYR